MTYWPLPMENEWSQNYSRHGSRAQTQNDNGHGSPNASSMGGDNLGVLYTGGVAPNSTLETFAEAEFFDEPGLGDSLPPSNPSSSHPWPHPLGQETGSGSQNHEQIERRQEYTRTLGVVDRLLLVNSSSSGPASAGILPELSFPPTRHTQSLASPLGTSISEQDILFNPASDSGCYDREWSGPAMLRPPRTVRSSISYPTSEGVSDYDDDFENRTVYSSGIGDFAPTKFPPESNDTSFTRPDSGHGRFASRHSISVDRPDTFSAIDSFQHSSEGFWTGSNPVNIDNRATNHEGWGLATTATTGFATSAAPHSGAEQIQSRHLPLESTPLNQAYLTVPGRARRRSDPPQPVTRSHQRRNEPYRHSPRVSFAPDHQSFPHPGNPHSTTEVQRSGSFRRRPRGKRSRVLTEDEKRDARQKRSAKSTCIACKLSKVKCDPVPGSDSCKKCSTKSSRSKCPRVCIRADFMEYLEKEPLDFLAHYSMNYACPDGGGLQRIDVPENVDLDEVQQQLRGIIREWETLDVYSGKDLLYRLDLKACLKYASSIRPSDTRISFWRLVCDVRGNNQEWETIIHFPQDGAEDLVRLIRCTEQLSSHTFIFSQSQNFIELNPNDPSHTSLFSIAAIFTRIVSRGLELKVCKKLQTDLFNSKPGCDPRTTLFVGYLLLSLRWRVSLWKVNGPGLPEDHRGLAEQGYFTDRVTNVCRILYFYYFFLLDGGSLSSAYRHLSSSIGCDLQQHATSSEDFPREESLEGFDNWMEEGKSQMRG